jgi:hypothetical protein
MIELVSALKDLDIEKSFDEANALIVQYDSDADGQVTFDEFLNIIKFEGEKRSIEAERLKAVAHNILRDLSATHVEEVAPNEFDVDNWGTKQIKVPGKPGLQTNQTFNGALICLAFIQCTVIVIYGACCRIHPFEGDYDNLYVMYCGVAFMMFFGFGYLMTFMKRYGMGSVGFTMLITVIGIQWGILTEVTNNCYHQRSNSVVGILQKIIQYRR